MFVIVWATLLFSVRSNNADSGASLGGEFSCTSESCIKLNGGEIKAEAGLCAVIPCSFIPRSTFNTTDLAWMKCEPSKQKCDQSDLIFHTGKDKKVQPGFKGRVLLLEPDVSLRNCSIIINDLTKSDSGSYQLRIVGINNKNIGDGFTFPERATVSVKDLSQRPTVMVPPLTAGQQTTLTCIAPGLCSGSGPKITWMWRGAGGKHITGNITDFKIENLTSVTQRHSSTLTFNASAEHHGTKVTCKVSFINDISTEETVTLNVTYMTKPVIRGKTSVEEGHALNLTCRVKSFPPSRITWTKLGSNTNLHSQPDINMPNNDSATLFIRNVTREDSGRYICTAEHLEKNVTVFADITVTYFEKPIISGKTTVEKGHALNLTCSVKSFPLSTITWSKNGFNTNLHSQPNTNMPNNDSATLFIQNVTTEDSGRYICTAEHLNTTMSVFADITVMYMTKPVITGKTSVKEGHALNLTCSFKSFPPSRITWTKLGSNTNLQSDPETNMSNNSDSATFFIRNVTRDDSGRYICTAEHLNTTISVFANITVTWFPKVLQNSKCKVQLNVLTCMCITEGFPLPTIKWPLLKKHTAYSVMTTVSDYTVNSTVTLTVKDHSSTAVECVSANENGEATENLIMRTDMSDEKDKFREIIKAVSRLEVIIAFLSGLLSSAVIFCLIKKYHRRKQRSSRNLDKSLVMVTSIKDNEMDPSQAVDDDQTNGGAVAAKEAALDPDGGPEDPQYASTDFSLLRRRSPRETATTQETTETEYAEVKKKVKEEREDGGKEEAEVLEVVEEEVLVGEDEETKQCAPEQKKGEDTAVYSNIKDIMSAI